MMQSTVNEKKLSIEEVEFYKSQGYLKIDRPVLAQKQFTNLKNHFEVLLDSHTKSGIRPEFMDKPHYLDTKLFSWIFSDDILDMVEQIIGPDILFFSSHFISKPSGDGRRVPWHEDSAYWKGILDPMEGVTVWLAIDESTVENGCMYVVPETHGNGFSDYQHVDSSINVFPTEIVSNQQFKERAIPLELKPNQASLHHAKTIHGSAANNSSLRRCGFTMRFLPGHVKLNPSWEKSLRVYLARGKDTANNNLANADKVYPELYEANKIYKSH